jgi:hypothetical protein
MILFAKPKTRLFALFLAVSLQASLVYAQAAKKSGQSSQSTASLAKPIDWGYFTARLFSDTKKVTFQLATSWIPGEKQKGMLRYKLYVFPDLSSQQKATAKDATDIEMAAQDEQLLKRVHGCVITLNLYDVDGFILRKVYVPLMQGVDDNAKLNSLSANESVQMDANEYRSLLGNSKASGNWNVSWACPPQ